ncbi:hypothetical protein D3C80_2176360 [compost metagenome]
MVEVAVLLDLALFVQGHQQHMGALFGQQHMADVPVAGVELDTKQNNRGQTTIYR